jgi:hypothetical protein
MMPPRRKASLRIARQNRGYEQPMSGRTVGRDAIVAGFVAGAEAIPGWQFPPTWMVIEGDRAVNGWDTVVPGQHSEAARPSGVAVFDYAGHGHFSHHFVAGRERSAGMAIMAISEVTARLDSVEELRTAMRTLVPGTRAFDGCLGIAPYAAEGDPAHIAFIEHWASRPHHER